jgi:CheY-like chemotaxis protein
VSVLPSRRLQIVVVEDESGVKNAIRRTLFDFDLREHATVEEAQFDLDWADVVILDIMLPGMDGDQVAQSWHEKAGIVAISGDPNRLVGVADHADVLLVKPIDAQMLRQGLLKAASRYHERAGASGAVAPAAPSLPAGMAAAAHAADAAIEKVDDPDQRGGLRVTMAVIFLVLLLFGVVWSAARVASADCRGEVQFWRAQYMHLIQMIQSKDEDLAQHVVTEIVSTCEDGCDDIGALVNSVVVP